MCAYVRPPAGKALSHKAILSLTAVFLLWLQDEGAIDFLLRLVGAHSNYFMGLTHSFSPGRLPGQSTQ